MTLDEFKKIEIRVGEIRSAEKIEGADKLLKLVVNFGAEERQVVSGIAEYFSNPQDLLGKRAAFVTNLEPRVIRGFESQAMLLATGGSGEPLHFFESAAPPGSRAR